ncbi:hypothetical protein KM043_006604 [Ampulex compressa]|nr:hypothetical protein KM043_006604 [Ampulex compressa]
MDDEWGDSNEIFQPAQDMSTFDEQNGRSYGKGRGFIAHGNNNEDYGVGSTNYSGRQDNRDEFKGYNANNGKDFGNSRPGRTDRGGARTNNWTDGRSNGRYGDHNEDGNRHFDNVTEYGYENGDNEFRPTDDGAQGFGNGFRGESNDSGRNYGQSYGGDNQYGNRGSRGMRGRGGNRNRERGDGGGDNFRRRGENDFDGRDSGRGGGRDHENSDKPREVYIPPEQPTDEQSLFGNGIEVGINFDKYDDIDIKISGENIPAPIESFEHAGLRNIVLENIRKSGYTKPTPVQKYALPIIMSGRDLMACAQTGSGKTAAFVVPIVNTLLEKPTELIVTSSHCEPQVVIVSPTRELTIQIEQQARKFALNSILKTVVAYGGTSVSYQGSKVSAGCHILVATPGRLLDFLRRGRITFSSVRFLVLDEADRMLDMGFLPDVEKIVDHETMVPATERQTLMFSATFPDEIQHLAGRFLNAYLFVAVGIVGGACTDVEQNFYEVTKFKKRQMLKELIEKENSAGRLKGILVFVEMKRTTDFIAAFLSENGYPTTSIHGDRLQREREEALNDFKASRMAILVATDVAARGLDIKNVSHVINYDMPKRIDDYVHRIGRTGRVGNRGRATSFFDPTVDEPLTGDLVRILKQASQPVPDWLEHGGGSRTFGPGYANKFGGEDVRNFNDQGGNSYAEEFQQAAEPDEAW